MNSKKIIIIAILLTIVIVLTEYVLLFTSIPSRISVWSMRRNLSENILIVTPAVTSLHGKITAIDGTIVSIEQSAATGNGVSLKNGKPSVLRVDVSLAAFQKAAPAVPFRFTRRATAQTGQKTIEDIHIGDVITVDFGSDLRLAPAKPPFRAISVTLPSVPFSVEGTVTGNTGRTLTVHGKIQGGGNATESTYTVYLNDETEISRNDVNSPLKPEDISAGDNVTVYSLNGVTDTFTADCLQIRSAPSGVQSSGTSENPTPSESR